MRGALPLGTYVERRGPIHELDARVKVLLLLLATIAVFARPTVLVIGACCVALGVLLALSGVSADSMVRAVRPCVVILVFVLVANLFVFDGSGDVVILHGFGMSLAGLERGFGAIVRIILLIGLALVVSATTTSTELADAVVWLLGPLGVLGVPVGDVAMVLSIALRFIPICAGEFDRIVAAQRARGRDFGAGSLLDRVKAWGSVLVPVVVALFGHADRLADAMRDRCYRGRGRTSMAERLGGVDTVVLAFGCALFVMALVWG
jgi:energy-coupling factor transporter transmembrane protein EcfT